MKTLASLGLVLLLAGTAHADRKADQLFEKGKKALAQKDYATACVSFEESDKLDPGIGVKMNAGACYEEWGKLSHAYDWYADAAALAEKQKDKRLDKIKEVLAQVDADVPKLTITVPPNSDLEGGAITLDGKPVESKLLGTEIRVDPGPHELAWNVGGAPKKKTLALERGGTREVQVDLDPAPVVSTNDPAAVGGEPVKLPEKKSDEPKIGQTRKLVSFVLVGAGAVALGISGALTLDARGTYNDAIDAHCGGTTTGCDDEGLKITHDARSRANIATGVAIVGLAAVGTGVFLYLTAPKTQESSVTVAPSVSSTAAGLTLSGAF